MMILHGLRKLCWKGNSLAKCKQLEFSPVFLFACLAQTLFILWLSLFWPSFTSNADSASSLHDQIRKGAKFSPWTHFNYLNFSLLIFALSFCFHLKDEQHIGILICSIFFQWHCPQMHSCLHELFHPCQVTIYLYCPISGKN